MGDKTLTVAMCPRCRSLTTHSIEGTTQVCYRCFLIHPPEPVQLELDFDDPDLTE